MTSKSKPGKKSAKKDSSKPRIRATLITVHYNDDGTSEVVGPKPIKMYAGPRPAGRPRKRRKSA